MAKQIVNIWSQVTGILVLLLNHRLQSL